uniref:NADH-ubiquinone oxidoreductase chain 4 n=1 Tax=Sinanodonta woodiana TaxID=1069815 RepID=A0A1L1WJ41_SINWO|nr:NADH dehydrogenase subunit 4 [Sinanodonta woodiana]
MLFSKLCLMAFSLVMLSVLKELSCCGLLCGFALSTELGACLSYKNSGVSSCSCGGVFNYDYLSCMMVWLSLFISGLSLLSSGSILSMKNSESSFLVCLLTLLIILVISFSVSSLLVFYVFFEFSLVVTFLIICGWGYQPERLRASKFMVLYTVGASLPLLAFILCVFYQSGSMAFSFLNLSGLVVDSFFVFLVGITAFLVKVPMYGLHMWLPKAHVEASVAGSMLLAGVLLKMGGYGLARFMKFFDMMGTLTMSCVMCLCMFGGMMGSIICCFQLDVKSLVAYSSVGHMSLVLCGFMSDSFLGFAGACLLMVAHGLSSPGMFYLVSEMHSLFGSRSMVIIRGMTGNLTGINFWLMLMCGFSAAAPPSLSICSEVILYISLMNYSFFFFFFLGSMSFISCLYSWLIYCNTQVGNYPNWVRSSSNVSSLYLQSVVCGSLSFPLIALCLNI